MKKNLYRAIHIFFISLSLCGNTLAQNDSVVNIICFNPIKNITIFALDAVSESKAWFAAQRGIWGYTEDAGKTWHIDSIKIDTIYPHFRSISVLNDSTVLLLSIVSPAYLLKTTNKGKTWKLVYKNTDKDIFFDSMKFYDPKNGIAIADPIEGRVPLIQTKEGGETWKEIVPVKMEKAEEGEAFYAASNSIIDVHANNIWFATGGKRSRIFHSTDTGKSFTTHNSPLPQGEKMDGIYSIDFFNETIGVIGGGNFYKADSTIASLAITNNGGKSWKIIKNKKPFFGSCVQFKNANEIFVTGMHGTFKYSIKEKKIIELKDNALAEINFLTLRFTPTKNAIWLAGSRGKIALITKLK